LNNTGLNDNLVKQDKKKEIKDCLVFNENEPTKSKPIGHNESSPKRKIHSSECCQKETRESINEQFDSTP
jgi:hypothetical protein